MNDGTVRCRGRNQSGELGIGSWDYEDHGTTAVPDLGEVEQVVGDFGSMCTRHRDGRVRCWGWNYDHALGLDPADDERCGTTSCRTRPTLLSGLTDVVHLAPGLLGYCAVRRDGSVWCWGDLFLPGPNFSRRRYATPTRIPELSDVVWLRMLLGGWIARHRDGTYDMREFLTTYQVPPGAEVPEGGITSSICYRLPDASIRCLGANFNGEVGNGRSSPTDRVSTPSNPGLCGVHSVSIGGYHACVVLADRGIACWGDAAEGGLGLGGTEQCAGISRPSSCITRPARVPGIDRVARLFLTAWGSCALRLDHRVWCWGTLAPQPYNAAPREISWELGAQ